MVASLCFTHHYHVVNKSAFSEVINVTSIEEDPGPTATPMGPGTLGTEIIDEDFDDGDEGISSQSPGVITPSEFSIRSSDGALTATTVKRRVVRVSDASFATYRDSSTPG